MTANQIKKTLAAAGIDMNTITEISKDSFEVFVDNGEGRADDKKTAKAYRAVKKVLNWGYFKSGYGSFCMRNGYTVSKYAGMGQSDPMHY